MKMQVHEYRACGVWRFPLIAVLIMLVIMSGNTPLFGQLIHGFLNRWTSHWYDVGKFSILRPRM